MTTTTPAPAPPTGVRLILGREPAAWLAALDAGLVLVVALGLPLSTAQTGAVLALVTAVLSAVTVFYVRPVAPAVFVGVVKAALVLVAAFGFDVPAEQQGAILAAVTVVLALILRQQVDPPVAGPGQVRTAWLGDRLQVSDGKTTVTSGPIVTQSVPEFVRQQQADQARTLARFGIQSDPQREGRHRDDDGDGIADGASPRPE